MSVYNVVNALYHDMQRGGDETRLLLENHLKTPDKVSVYYSALSKCIVGSQLVFSPGWSWWAFFGGAFFYFYRKMYQPAFVLILLAVFLFYSPVAFASLAINIVSALVAKYLYCRKFIMDLARSGYPERPLGEAVQSLSVLGGYNTWAVVLGIFVNFLYILGLFIAAMAILGVGMFAIRSFL